jgi:hypothetical protein
MSFPMAEVKPTISDLPEEILLEVFSYLTHFDIYQNIRKVCVGWKILSECACLWKCIDMGKEIELLGFYCYSNDLESKVKVMKSWLEVISCHMLSLDIGHNFDWFVRCVQNNLLIAFPKVTKLQIDLPNFDIDGIITKFFPNVRDLRLKCDMKFVGNVFNTLNILRNLECIELSFVPPVNAPLYDTECDNINEKFETLFQFRPNLTRIKADILTCSSVKALLSNCQMLEYLDIEYCINLDSEAFDSMPMKYSLLTLNMDNTYLDDKCLKIITQNAPNLRHLSLQRCVYVTDVGFSYVGTRCTKLETLIVNKDAYSNGRNITNVGVDSIARGCEHLKVFVAKYCQGITDEGIQSIAEHCRNMSILKVTGCTGITGTGVEYLAYGCLSLRHVEFDECVKVTSKSVNHLIVNCIWLETVKFDSCNFIYTLKFKNFLFADNSISPQGFVGNDQQIIRNLSLQDVVNSGNTTDVVNITNNTSANIDDETVLVTTATNGNTLIFPQTISSHENIVTNENTVASTISADENIVTNENTVASTISADENIVTNENTVANTISADENIVTNENTVASTISADENIVTNENTVASTISADENIVTNKNTIASTISTNETTTLINEHKTNMKAVTSNYISADKTTIDTVQVVSNKLSTADKQFITNSMNVDNRSTKFELKAANSSCQRKHEIKLTSKSNVNTLKNASCKNTEVADIIPQTLKINYRMQDTLPRHSHMCILHLSFCPNIGDDSVKEIADFCPDLREVYFSGTFLITDASIQYLLKKCVYLKVLDISGGSTLAKSTFTDKVLISVANYGNNLQELLIHKNNKITILGIRELVQTSTSLKSVSLTEMYSTKSRLGISLDDCDWIVEELGKNNVMLKHNKISHVISIIIKNNCWM